MNQIQYEQLDSFPSQLLETALYIVEGIKEPKHSDALIIIASTYNKLGCRDRALKTLDLDLIVQRLNLIESYQTKINILLQIESIYSDYYRTREIIDQFNSYLKFIEKDSVKINILRRLSNLYINIGRYERAQLILQEVLKSINTIRNSGNSKTSRYCHYLQ